MKDDSMTEVTCENTDRELWRESPDDYYSPSLHVTAQGGIGMNVGGYVIVMPIRQWHEMAMECLKPEVDALKEKRE